MEKTVLLRLVNPSMGLGLGGQTTWRVQQLICRALLAAFCGRKSI